MGNWLVRAVATVVLLVGLGVGGRVRADDGFVILKWKHDVTLLRQTRLGPVTRRTSSDLPVPVEIQGTEDDFFRFVDPKTGEIWLVSKFDVQTNHAAARGSDGSGIAGTCVQFGSMGIKQGCTR